MTLLRQLGIVDERRGDPRGALPACAGIFTVRDDKPVSVGQASHLGPMQVEVHLMAVGRQQHIGVDHQIE